VFDKGFGGIIDVLSGQRRMAFNNDDKTDSIEEVSEKREEISEKRFQRKVRS